MTDSIPLITPPSARLRPALQGGVAILPLCLAVVPWGVLAGSMALQSGLTPAQGLGMSAIVFAGASQLVAMGMIKGSAGLLAILLSTFFVTAQHFLYALRLRERIAPLPLRWRLALGFLLTDELFALTGEQTPARFNRWYALGAGLTFYLCWFLSTLLGIVAAGSAGDLDGYGLDFSIAATFIAIVVPLVRSLPGFSQVRAFETLGNEMPAGREAEAESNPFDLRLNDAQRQQLLAQEQVKGVHVGGDDPQHIVVAPGHGGALHHLGPAGHGGLKSVQVLRRRQHQPRDGHLRPGARRHARVHGRVLRRPFER